MGLSAHDQTFALRVDLKEITELSGVKKQAGAELYPKLSKKFKKVRKKCEKHQIFRKLAADSSADASADEVGRINIGEQQSLNIGILGVGIFSCVSSSIYANFTNKQSYKVTDT